MGVWVVEVTGSIPPQGPFLDFEEKERYVGIGNNRTGTAVAVRASGMSAPGLEWVYG